MESHFKIGKLGKKFEKNDKRNKKNQKKFNLRKNQIFIACFIKRFFFV